MDPISDSNYNLNADISEETEDKFASSKSLSDYEQRNIKNLLPQIIASVISTSSHLIVGISLAYSAILIPQLEAEDSDIAVTKTQTSWIASVLALIAPIGALLSGYMMDKMGRINALKVSSIPGIVGWIFIALAWNVPMIIIGRVITGLASSLATSPAVVYITEIARRDMRGSLLSLGPAYVSLGMVMAYVKGWLLHWRTVAWLCNIYMGTTFAQLQLNCLMLEQERKIEANSDKGKFKAFLKPTGYKPLLILTGLFFFQQFSGVYIFLFYSVTFFQAAGTSVNPYMASILIGLIRLLMSMVNTYMLKSFNRRILIVTSAIGMAICIFTSGLFTHWIKTNTTTYKWVPVVFLLGYMISSNIGLLPIPWTMTAELFPLKIRSMAHSITTSVVNVMMFLAVQNYANLETVFGGSAGLQWFFAGISLMAGIYTFVFLPETHGKKLADIEDYFNHHTVYLTVRRDSRKEVSGINMVFNANEQICLEETLLNKT